MTASAALDAAGRRRSPGHVAGVITRALVVWPGGVPMG
jgi:hypothetical protein